ncbi:ABC transporter permease [Bacillus carboniphilus]|uniref:ABC transporter permease n=1 Tax=Bacillus carboniphilus TaxID=86663 RepID=A0ABP3G542_9BACI
MQTITIAYYTFLRNIRDTKGLLACTLLPIVLMLILGNALNSEFTPKTLEKLKVGVYLEEENGMVQSTLYQFFQSEELSSLTQWEEVASLEEGIEMVKSNQLEGLISYPMDKHYDLENGSQGSIQYYTRTKDTFFEPFLESYIRTFNLNVALLNLNKERFVPNDENANIEEVKVITEGKIPRGIDYYSIVTLFQALLLSGLFGIFAVTKDSGNHTNVRFLTAPIRNHQIILGKLIGSTLTLYSITVFIFLVSKFAFGANWDGNIILILTVLFLFSITATSFGMLLAYLCKSTMMAALTLFIVSTIFTLLAGGFSPLEGKAFDVLGKISPSSYSQEVLFTNIYEGTIDTPSLVGVLVYTTILVTFTFVLGRRRVV